MQGNWSQLDWLKGDGPRTGPLPKQPTTEGEHTHIFPYRPRMGVLLLGIVLFGGGAIFMYQRALTNDRGLTIDMIPLSVGGATVFYWCMVGVSVAFVAGGIFFVVPQVFIKRNVILEPDAITVPGWGFSTKHYRIPWNEIESVSCRTYKQSIFITIVHRGHKRAINSVLLPNRPDMETIQHYIRLKLDPVNSLVGA